MKQLRMPQHDPALLRLNNLSSSELVSAVNPKQFAMSGAFSGALPLWLNNEKWIVKDGWLANSGPMTLRLDKDTADAVVKDNIFTLWRSLRFGDNLQAWLEQNVRLPGNDCPQGKECEEKQ